MRSPPTLDRRTYRWLDRTTKLLGVAAVAVALEVGLLTAPGIALAALGVVAALCTVPIRTPESTDGTGSADAIEGEPA